MIMHLLTEKSPIRVSFVLISSDNHKWKKSESDRLFCFSFLNLTLKTNKCLVFNIAISGSDQKYEMKKPSHMTEFDFII